MEYLYFHPESDCFYVDFEGQTDGLAEQIAVVKVEGKVMRVHFPECYEAHRLRGKEFLQQMARNFGLTYEEFESSNWDTTGKVTEMSDIQIDDGVQMPADVAAETPAAPKKRGRKAGSKNAPSMASNLLTALEFVSPVKSETYEFSHYVSLTNHVALAYNNIIAAGYPIQETLSKAVHLEKLVAALKKSSKTLTLTETPTQLSVKGDKLLAKVPVLSDPLAPMLPDECVYSGDYEGLKEAFRVAGTLASETAERPVECSLLLNPGTVTGTNGKTMLQYWHGFNELPPGTVIPKAFAAAVAATKQKIVGIGAAWNGSFATSFTLYFEGGAWMKTQCYEERWPEIEHLLGVPNEHCMATPADLFDGLSAIEPFLEESSAVVFIDGAILSRKEEHEASRYDIKGLPGGKVFNCKLMKQIGPWCKTIDFASNPDRAWFFGGTDTNPIRGVIMGMAGSQ